MLSKSGDDVKMLSKMAWNAFKKTGDINLFLEFIETKNIEENLLEDKDGNHKNESDYFKRKQYGRF